MKLYISLVLFLVFLIGILPFVAGHGEEDFAEAEEIIKMKVACENLSEEQFEILGDYYMEQLHPGELHEAMDERMGGEGSSSLTQMHIAMGKAFYCGERGAVPSSMMNTMMGRGMMGGYGMMAGYNYNTSSSHGFWILLWIVVILLVALIILIILLLKSKSKSKFKRR